MKTLLPFIGSLLLLSSCVKNNPAPVWLSVSEWQLESNGLGSPEGELTENLSDAWVYVDNQFVGIFEVPFKIPLLVNGSNKSVRIYPTIKNNGISATKKIYPFLEPFEVFADLVQNDTLHLDPTTRYYQQVDFTIWDFESADSGIEESPSSSAALVMVSDPSIIQPFNGGQFARVVLDETNSNWIASTNFEHILPKGGAEVYLEVDYHAEADVVTGVLAIDGTEVTQNPNVQFNGQDPDSVTVEWKKIYIDMSTIVSGSPTADFFRNSFEAILPSGKTQAIINIDNIKVVHF